MWLADTETIDPVTKSWRIKQEEKLSFNYLPKHLLQDYLLLMGLIGNHIKEHAEKNNIWDRR